MYPGPRRGDGNCRPIHGLNHPIRWKEIPRMKQSKTAKSVSLSPWMEVEEGMLLVIPRNHRRGHAPAPPPAEPPEACPPAKVYGRLEVSIMAHYCAGPGAAILHRMIGTQAQSERNAIGSTESHTPSEGHVMLWGQSRPQCPQTPVPLLPQTWHGALSAYMPDPTQHVFHPEINWFRVIGDSKVGAPPNGRRQSAA